MIQCTRRESDVLVLLAHGLSNKVIALRLGLSPHTVRDHVYSLMQRHGLANRVELIMRASTRPWQIGGRRPALSVGQNPRYGLERKRVGASQLKTGHPLHL